jgi:hypothetical protein
MTNHLESGIDGTAIGTSIMTQRSRNYAAEYLKRKQRGRKLGLSVSQARGHPKSGERPAGKLSALADHKIQFALRELRKQRNLAVAAKAAKISPERLRRFGTENGLIQKVKGKWQIKSTLPRRMPIFSDGKSVAIIVGDEDSASDVGKYNHAVKRFLETNNQKSLMPFQGASVIDINQKRHPYETRPNILYRLSATGENSFEQIYRIII